MHRAGLHTTPSKQQAIVEARAPTNITELCSFLGLVNYYIWPFHLQSGYSATSIEPHAAQGNLLELDLSVPEDLPRDLGDLGFSSSSCPLYDPLLSLTLAADASAYRVY